MNDPLYNQMKYTREKEILEIRFLMFIYRLK